jgi:LPXTG-motif cell wall-anchored protein
VSARLRVALVVLGAALVPAPAFGAALTHTSPVAQAAQSESDELSPTPPLQGENENENGDGNSGSNSGSNPTPPTAAPAAPLPDTGADLPTMALMGLGLLVSGIGLRMRTVDERVF